MGIERRLGWDNAAQEQQRVLAEALSSARASAVRAVLAAGGKAADLVVAAAPETPAEILLDIARRVCASTGPAYHDSAIYDALAENPSSDSLVFDTLLRKPSRPWSGLAAMGGNPSASAQTLAHLATRYPGGGASWGSPDHEVRVRMAVAGNPSAPAWLLARLARDPISLVRARVIRNPHTPLFALTEMVAACSTQAEGMAVQNRFQGQIADLEAIFRYAARISFAKSVAGRPVSEAFCFRRKRSLSAEEHERLASSANARDRRQAAESLEHELPEGSLEDRDPDVRLTALAHPSVDPRTSSFLRRLAEADPDARVRQAALDRGKEAGAYWAVPE